MTASAPLRFREELGTLDVGSAPLRASFEIVDLHALASRAAEERTA